MWNRIVEVMHFNEVGCKEIQEEYRIKENHEKEPKKGEDKKYEKEKVELK